MRLVSSRASSRACRRCPAERGAAGRPSTSPPSRLTVRRFRISAPQDVEIRIGDRVRTIRTLRRVAPQRPRPVAPPVLRAALRHQRQRQRRPPFHPRRRPGIVPRRPRAAAARRGRGVRRADDAARRAMVATLPLGGVTAAVHQRCRRRVRRAIDGISGQAPSNETGSALACRTRRFLESLDGFLGAAAAPTRSAVDRRPLHGRHGRAAARRADGAGARHVRAARPTCSGASARAASAARRERLTCCSRPTSA